MKKILLLSAFQLVLILAFAQLTPEQRIQDSVIGWWKKLTIPLPKPPSNGRTLSIKQQELLANFIKWMQQSYTPVGGIGTYQFKSYSTKEPGFAPSAYGVDFRVWNVSFKSPWVEANGDFKPISEEYTRYDINANGIPGSYPIPFINTPTQYLFTWPPNGYNIINKPEQENSLSENSNTAKFLTRVNELSTVYLAPDNKLPFIPVSKGELLQLAEEALERQLQREKEYVENKWPGNLKAQQDAFEFKKINVEKYRVNIRQLREKHKNTLNEHAVLQTMQATMYSFEINPDPFKISENEEKSKRYFPVYKIEPDVLKKCKTDHPQWIAVSFPYNTKEDGNQLYEMYRSLTEHFNYQYVQDYFFYPEKVKGISYKPVNQELLYATLDNYRKKGNSKISTPVTALPTNVLLMDDFTGNADGGKPAGWYYSTFGKHSIVTTVKNKPGKWVQLGYGNPLSSTSMKKPLPENFTLEYEMATDEFNSRTGGAVMLYLSTYPLNKDGTEDKRGNGTFVNITLTSGNEADYNNNNYRGEVNIEIHTSPAVNIENNSEGTYFKYALREFTNIKSKVHVTLEVNSGELKLLINEKQVATSADFKMTYGKPCISCKFPANSKFNTIHWKNTTNDAENVKVYISNIKITKEY
ncbi:MAG: hypothetical protein ACXWV9_08550 [Flavisolibacter sp.]